MNDRTNEQPDEDRKTRIERQQEERGVEHDQAMAANQNRAPAEQHRGGPLPNQKR